ncbi:WD40-repeat-containing domain protein, partial [Amylostereum chailletii]
MPFPTYLEHLIISKPHAGVVNRLAFSPTASYLASGGADGFVNIWDMSTGKELRQIDLGKPVISLKWTSLSLRGLVAGCGEGACKIFEDVLKPTDIGTNVTTGALGPVFCVDIDRHSRHLALGAGPEVHMASCWDLKTLTMVWKIVPRIPEDFVGVFSSGNHSTCLLTLILSAHSSLSMDGRFLIVAMVLSTVDVYNVSRLELVHFLSYSARLESTVSLPVTTSFLQNTQAVMCGSECGNVYIWDRRGGDLLQVLPHQDSVVLKVCAIQTQDAAYIASTTEGAHGGEGYISIWVSNKETGFTTSLVDIWRVNY